MLKLQGQLYQLFIINNLPNELGKQLELLDVQEKAETEKQKVLALKRGA